MQQLLPAQAQKAVQASATSAASRRTSVTSTPRPTLPSHRLFARHHLRYLGLPLTTILILVAWQTLVTVGAYKTFILPSPATVLERFISAMHSGVLWHHTLATLSVALGGFSLALVIAIVLGYTLAHIAWLERVLAPVLAATQAVPVLAVAPLIVLWFSTGWQAKILVATLITFFPMLLSTITALQRIPRELREIARISGANRWQLFRYVEVPLALPVFFSGVRTGLSLATTGAVVAEFVAGRSGLGAMITIARGLFDTPLIFVALIMLASITLVLYMLAVLLEHLLVDWN